MGLGTLAEKLGDEIKEVWRKGHGTGRSKEYLYGRRDTLIRIKRLAEAMAAYDLIHDEITKQVENHPNISEDDILKLVREELETK